MSAVPAVATAPSRPRSTPLRAEHEAAGAKLAEFGGWTVPLRFAGEVAEHTAVRTDVGMFDVSHLGTVWVTGPAAVDTLARAFTADAHALSDGGSRYALCLTDEGGVLDDLIIARFAAERWLVVPNAANTAAVVDRLRTVAAEVRREAAAQVAQAARADEPDPAAMAVGTTKIDDATVGWATVAVQGPRSFAAVAAALDLDAGHLAFTEVAELPVGAAGPATVAGIHLVVSRTGYTGEVGLELQIPAEHAVACWRALRAADVTPCGLGARDTLRLEMGYPLHGNDLDATSKPAEGRVGWAVQTTDGAGAPRDFVGAAALADDPGTRRLIGLRGTGRRPLRAGLAVLHEGERIGTTTSGGFSPTSQRGIALARVAHALEPGTAVTVELRGTPVDVEVVRPPFVDRDPRG